MIQLRSKTGGCTSLGAYSSGLFIHQDELYCVNEKQHEKWEDRYGGTFYDGLLQVTRCNDGNKYDMPAKATIYPVEAAL